MRRSVSLPDPPVEVQPVVARVPEAKERTKTWFENKEYETAVFTRDELRAELLPRAPRITVAELVDDEQSLGVRDRLADAGMQLPQFRLDLSVHVPSRPRSTSCADLIVGSARRTEHDECRHSQKYRAAGDGAQEAWILRPHRMFSPDFSRIRLRKFVAIGGRVD